jgi:hypothetical protein
MESYTNCVRQENQKLPPSRQVVPTYRAFISHTIKKYKDEHRDTKVRAISVDDIRKAIAAGTLSAQDLHQALQDK